MAVSKYDVEVDLAGAPETSHARMVELVGSNKRVLDVGCSTGYLARVLTALGNTVSGVEYDAAAAKEAEPDLDRLVVGDLEALDLVEAFGEGAFDVVVFGDVLEHLRDPLPVLRGARPLLSPGGSVVISVPNIAHGDVRLALLKGRFRYTKLGLLDETHTRFFTRENLDSFLHDAGFVAVDVRRTYAPLFSTEVGIRADEVDPAVVEQLRAEPEAETYQFVLRAVRDDAVHVDIGLTDRAERLDLRVRELAHEVEQARGFVDAAAAERDEAADRAARAERDAATARAETERLRTELRTVYQTRVMRASRIPRALYGAMRARQR
ncbi:MAG TPA: class I SAM-dependent methyltransferase [Mycobacteriales bacterium]|nr:class I SAM-dependent methyltransferase [Mycobacteriales bacterium]